jgi:hypothetical protein
MVRCIPVELGVCQRPATSLKEKGSWSYYTIPVPADTPAEQLEEVATCEFLNKHEDILVHKTWIQSIGPEMIVEIEAEE